MAQIRGSWFGSVRSALDRRGIYTDVETHLASTTKHIVRNAEVSAWYDEGHAVAVYEAVATMGTAAGLDAETSLARVRELGKDAAQIAMRTTWRQMMSALAGLMGGTPRMAFEQMPLLWNATRRDAGALICAESSSKQALTVVSGFAYAASEAWVAVWLGHHDALLEALRFSGDVVLDSVDAKEERVRVRVRWATRLGPQSPELE